MGFFFKDEFLPTGVEAFHAWADEVIALTPLPNNDSMKFALASIILELDKSKGRMNKHEMATMLVKGAANQVAAFVFQDIKAKRIAADEAKRKLEEEAPNSDDLDVENHVPSLNVIPESKPEAPVVIALAQVSSELQTPKV